MGRLWLVLVVTLAAGPVLAAFEVPVVVEEPAGVARTNEPVSGGIPLPAGRFKPDATFALFDGERAIPVQVTPLVVGPKGFLRWVLLDYQLTVKANERRTLTLRTGTPASLPAAAGPLKIQETAAGVTVDTGRVAFTVSKTAPFGLVEGVRVGGKPVLSGGVVSYLNGLDGKRYRAAPPDTVTVHYAGPMRATIEVRGHFTGDTETKLRFRTTITTWAGRSDILVKHSLINSRPDMKYYVQIKGSRIELKPTAPAETVLVGAEKPVTLDRKEGAVLLHQGLTAQAARPAALTAGKRQVWAGKGAGGWIAASSVWVADRLFASDPPRSLGVGQDGSIILDAAPARFEGENDSRGRKRVGVPFDSTHRWLFDCTHHSSEYRIDFTVPADAVALARQAKAAAARVWGFAPGSWYSACNVLGVGRFGTLDDEKACHKQWGWTAGKEPTWPVNPTRFVPWEDNHYESEADSTEAMLLMFLRTGKRGFFDEGEAWARYHTDIQAWRTEGWAWKDGAIWWPGGGPPGNRPVRTTRNRGFASWNKGTPDDRTLWHIAWAKGCYCHHYGAGLVDFYCLTGDRNALDAAIDDCKMKLNEFTRSRAFKPGTTGISSTRGFGRGFYVAVRTWMVQPTNPTLVKLITLCRDTFAQLPATYIDERGVYAPVARAPKKQYLTPGIKAYMQKHGITVAKDGTFTDKTGNTWKWRDMGGTWMIAYIQNAIDLLAEQTGDEAMMDYAIAAGQFTAKYMLSPVAKQTWYYTALDIPNKGDIWDNWKYDGLKRNADGEGPRHSGWYTRFFPDACGRAYSWTGEKRLLEAGKQFWSYGNRRQYQSTHLTKQHNFAYHIPPKNDCVLSTARLFYEWAHPRADQQSPAAVGDLAVTVLEKGKARVEFTAPADVGGKVVRYQVKADVLPIVPYEAWDYARDDGKKRNWWKAVNCTGEPAPSAPGTKERFAVSNVPSASTAGDVYFAVRSFDDHGNRSAISNVVAVRAALGSPGATGG